MKNLFLIAGPVYMSVLTMLLVAATTWMIYHFILVYNSKQISLEKTLRNLGYGRSIGFFAMITGIFAQLTGFYQIFSSIEKAGDVCPLLIYTAIKVSLITTVYGILIYLFSLLLWFILNIIVEKKVN